VTRNLSIRQNWFRGSRATPTSRSEFSRHRR